MAFRSARRGRAVASIVTPRLAPAVSCPVPALTPKRDLWPDWSSGRATPSWRGETSAVDGRPPPLCPALGFPHALISAGVSDVECHLGRAIAVIVHGLTRMSPTGCWRARTPRPRRSRRLRSTGAGFILHFPMPAASRGCGPTTPEALRGIITRKPSTNRPPIRRYIVRRTAGDGSTVTVTGVVGRAKGRPNRSSGPPAPLSAMLAAAGGVTISPEIAQVRLVRWGGGGSKKRARDDLVSGTCFRGPLGRHRARAAANRILVEEDKPPPSPLMGATAPRTVVPSRPGDFGDRRPSPRSAASTPSLDDPTGRVRAAQRARGESPRAVLLAATIWWGHSG